MKGGFLETLSDWGSSISQGASDLWKKTKDTTSSMTSSSSSTPAYQTSNTYQTPTPTPTYNTTTNSTTSTMGYGGRRRRTKRRRMRGGFEDNTPVTGLAANAGSFSGQTAQPQTIVGGKTRRRHRRKTRRH